MEKILVVDDEKKICEFIKASLESEGYMVDLAYNGREALNKFDNNEYNLIVLDRMLPDITGEEICINIREKSEIPIIMLTAKIEDEDKIEGFKIGCDDYICKPFNILEFLYRVKAILKRGKVKEDKIIYLDGELEIDFENYEVKVSGSNIYLTNTEFKILSLLAKNPKKVYTREELLEKTIEDYYERADRAIDNHIKNLRQKIEKINNCHIIQTVYGVGYKFGLEKKKTKN